MRWRRQRRPAPLPSYRDDWTLPVRVSATDPAEADSAVLARHAADPALDLTRPLLVRHHLLLPGPDAVGQAALLLAQDGYQLTLVSQGPPAQVRAWRTQLLTALSAAQERSRMAGLAQRLGGDVRGWDACG
ncbi:MAG: ribonuclease E inhibitor RraB [Mycobacteriales bacterium]